MPEKNVNGKKIYCPKCPNVVLVERTHSGLLIHECPRCSGIWLDKGELNQIAHPAEGDLEYCSKEDFAEDRKSGFVCPLCPNVKMKKVNFISYSDITMDYCEKCEGLWLDRGELDAIIAEVEKLNHLPETWEHRIMVFLSKLPF